MAEFIVGTIDDFPPGSHKVVALRNSHIGVFNVNGTLHALPNVCPHQFGPLCTGTVNGTWACSDETGWKHAWIRNGEILTCPWHGIEFDIVTGVSLVSDRLKVRRFQIDVENGQVKITL